MHAVANCTRQQAFAMKYNRQQIKSCGGFHNIKARLYIYAVRHNNNNIRECGSTLYVGRPTEREGEVGVFPWGLEHLSMPI